MQERAQTAYATLFADIDALRALPQAEREAEALRLIAQGEAALNTAGRALVAAKFRLTCSVGVDHVVSVGAPEADDVRWNPASRRGAEPSAHEAAMLARYRKEAAPLVLRVARLLSHVEGLGGASLEVHLDVCHLRWSSQKPPEDLPIQKDDDAIDTWTGSLCSDIAALKDLRAAAQDLARPAAGRHRITFRRKPSKFAYQDIEMLVEGADGDDAVRRLLAFERARDRLQGVWKEGQTWRGRMLFDVAQPLDVRGIVERLRPIGAFSPGDQDSNSPFRPGA